VVFIVMSSLVYVFPEYFRKIDATLSKGLFVALISIILIELMTLIPSFSQLRNSRLISYVVIAIFSLYVSHDTTRMFALSEKCKNMPNYPKASIGFFLDIINLFSRFSRLSR
jgi:FtsH-binding integral membrane protein